MGEVIWACDAKRGALCMEGDGNGNTKEEGVGGRYESRWLGSVRVKVLMVEELYDKSTRMRIYRHTSTPRVTGTKLKKKIK